VPEIGKDKHSNHEIPIKFKQDQNPENNEGLHTLKVVRKKTEHNGIYYLAYFGQSPHIPGYESMLRICMHSQLRM
jgi:hypothetical protein